MLMINGRPAGEKAPAVTPFQPEEPVREEQKTASASEAEVPRETAALEMAPKTKKPRKKPVQGAETRKRR